MEYFKDLNATVIYCDSSVNTYAFEIPHNVKYLHYPGLKFESKIMSALDIVKTEFVAAGAGIQFTFGLGAMSGPFLCSIFMNIVGSNGFFVFLLFFHALIGAFGVYRMKIRQTVDNPDSQFVAMPSTITPAGIELNPITEPIEEPKKIEPEIIPKNNIIN